MEPIFLKIRNGKITSIKGFDANIEALNEYAPKLKRALIEIHGDINEKQLSALLSSLDKIASSINDKELYFLIENYNTLISILLWILPRKIVLIAHRDYIEEPSFFDIIERILNKSSDRRNIKVGADTLDTLAYIADKCLLENIVLTANLKGLCNYIDSFQGIIVFRTNSTSLLLVFDFSNKIMRIYLPQNGTSNIPLEKIVDHAQKLRDLVSELTIKCSTPCEGYEKILTLIIETIMSNRINLRTLLINERRLFAQKEYNSLFIEGDLTLMNQNILLEGLDLLQKGKSVRININPDKTTKIVYGLER